MFTLPAESVGQANTTALAILECYPFTLLSLRVLTTSDFDRITDAIELPPLVSVTEAASALGVSRQSVLEAINTERADALAPWLEYYNTRRRHSALGGLPPISRLQPT